MKTSLWEITIKCEMRINLDKSPLSVDQLPETTFNFLIVILLPLNLNKIILDILSDICCPVWNFFLLFSILHVLTFYKEKLFFFLLWMKNPFLFSGKNFELKISVACCEADLWSLARKWEIDDEIFLFFCFSKATNNQWMRWGSRYCDLERI